MGRKTKSKIVEQSKMNRIGLCRPAESANIKGIGMKQQHWNNIITILKMVLVSMLLFVAPATERCWLLQIRRVHGYCITNNFFVAQPNKVVSLDEFEYPKRAFVPFGSAKPTSFFIPISFDSFKRFSIEYSRCARPFEQWHRALLFDFVCWSKCWLVFFPCAVYCCTCYV